MTWLRGAPGWQVLLSLLLFLLGLAIFRFSKNGKSQLIGYLPLLFAVVLPVWWICHYHMITATIPPGLGNGNVQSQNVTGNNNTTIATAPGSAISIGPTDEVWLTKSKRLDGENRFPAP